MPSTVSVLVQHYEIYNHLKCIFIVIRLELHVCVCRRSINNDGFYMSTTQDVNACIYMYCSFLLVLHNCGHVTCHLEKRL